MDPRNFLDDTYVFQFLSHEYDGSTQTKEGLTGMVSGSFLSGTTDSTGTGGSSSSGGSSTPGGSSSSGSSSSSVSQEGPGGRNGATGDTNHGLVWQEAALPAAVLLVRAALHPAAMM